MTASVCFFICAAVVRATAGDELETVEVKEGATVTLRTDWPGERDADIVWMFGTTNTGIALKDSWSSSTHYDERFRDRLQLDTKTGSLTIRNISTTHSGDYKVQIYLYTVIFNKHFNLTVYAYQSMQSQRIHINREKESTSNLCTVICSVTNGPKVNLSWIRNRDTLKQSSNPDLSVPLCLHLEINLQENHIYSCVAANPISNQSTQLNIMQFCPQIENTGSPRQLCFLLCSVENGKNVSFSWYEEKEGISSISSSDSSERLYLPLSINLTLRILTHLYIQEISLLNSLSLFLSASVPSRGQYHHSVEFVVRLGLSAAVILATISILLYHFTSRTV
ncbi:uncharacterized protein LOC118816824 [Colossoma macropomum]|uniref:uncharacterized protein LOC118816824 n=1 Tax=Colossoma macropomum TaxID=42526 RepID=UPI001865698D|nr:uncharacterized protein LOC118816824 [Colossoma macropomum]